MRLPFGWRLTRARESAAELALIRSAILILTKATMDAQSSLAALQAAVAANTSATQAAVAKIGTPSTVTVQGVDPAAVDAATAAIEANTNALTSALNPPAPAEPAAA